MGDTGSSQACDVSSSIFPNLFYVSSSWFLSKIVSQEDLKSPKKLEMDQM